MLYETSANENTNPTREYATTAPVWKGGLFYHKIQHLDRSALGQNLN